MSNKRLRLDLTSGIAWRVADNYSDWIVIVGEKQYNLHKVYLAVGKRASAYFQAQIRFQRTPCTNLTDVLPSMCHGEVFESMLDFIYGEDIDFEAKSIAPLLKLADVLQISMLSDQTHEVLQDILRTLIFEEPGVVSHNGLSEETLREVSEIFK